MDAANSSPPAQLNALWQARGYFFFPLAAALLFAAGFLAGFFAFGFSSEPSSVAGFAFASGFGFGPLVGLAPWVRISEMRISTKSCRWPRLRREFLRRRFLKAITFGPRPWLMISAA